MIASRSQVELGNAIAPKLCFKDRHAFIREESHNQVGSSYVVLRLHCDNRARLLPPATNDNIVVLKGLAECVQEVLLFAMRDENRWILFLPNFQSEKTAI